MGYGTTSFRSSSVLVILFSPISVVFVVAVVAVVIVLGKTVVVDVVPVVAIVFAVEGASDNCDSDCSSFIVVGC